jgi:MerR family mercuric resistance operon transcriptional regulator
LIDTDFMLHPVATTGSRRFFVRPIKALRAGGMPIGGLSRLCGVNIETIHYYEKIKMLPAPLRTERGHRVYGPKETRILVFIRRGRELGFWE